MISWPFSDPPNVAVFVSQRILSGTDWIHYACHDEDDGAWQFHGSSGPMQESEARVVGLMPIVEQDATVSRRARSRGAHSGEVRRRRALGARGVLFGFAPSVRSTPA
jgi:hypothetical protein